MRVLCLGDSNTYGYDPRCYFGGRYSAQSRWVDLLAQKTGWEIINAGENGREIPKRPITLPKGLDLLIVMLGTNDLLQGTPVDETTVRMQDFLERLTIHRDKIVLIAPPVMKLGAWVTQDQLIEASQKLAVSYRTLAQRMGLCFVDASMWDIALTFDGVHFSEEGHKVFAAELAKEMCVKYFL